MRVMEQRVCRSTELISALRTLEQFARFVCCTFGLDQPAFVMVASHTPNPMRPARLYQVQQRGVFIGEFLSKGIEIHASPAILVRKLSKSAFPAFKARPLAFRAPATVIGPSDSPTK